MLKKLGDNLDRIFVILHISITAAIGKSARFVRRLLLMLLSSLKCRGIGAGSREPAKEKRIGLR